MGRAKPQPPKRLSAAQLRSLASRGQTGRSQITRAAQAQRSRVATASLRQPKRTTVIRRTISDSVSVRSPPRQQITRVKPSGGNRKPVITKRRFESKTQFSSKPKPRPKIITRGQQRQRQSVARQPFVIDFADLKQVSTRGFQTARQSVRTNIFNPVRIGGGQARQRFDFFVGDFFGPRDSEDFGFGRFTRKGGSF